MNRPFGTVGGIAGDRGQNVIGGGQDGSVPATDDKVRSVLFGLIAGLLVAGVLAAVFDDTLLDQRSSASTTATTAARAPGAFDEAVDDVRAVVPVLQRFVERERGLRFLKEVNVTLLDEASFRARLADDTGDDMDALEETTKVLRALGLLDRSVDLEDARNDLLAAAVAGFYDPETEELVVRGARPTALVRRILVHELTHALQDQHFELHRPDLDERDDEAGLTFSALVEGDAVRIERAYTQQLSAEERRSAELEEAGQARSLIGASIPPVLLQVLAFPYTRGPGFVDAVIEAGGQARLDAAFADPPATTEHILHPETYLDGEPGRSVAPPPAENEVFDQGVLGEFGLYLVLAAELPPARSALAARGWGGDWYVAWDEGRDACVRGAVTMDDARDRDELRDALDDWAAAHGDADVTVIGGRITFTACG